MRNWVKASQGMILLILLRYYSGHHKRIKRSTSNILRRFVGGKYHLYDYTTSNIQHIDVFKTVQTVFKQKTI